MSDAYKEEDSAGRDEFQQSRSEAQESEASEGDKTTEQSNANRHGNDEKGQKNDEDDVTANEDADENDDKKMEEGEEKKEEIEENEDIKEPEREVKGNNSCLQSPTDIGRSETTLGKKKAYTVNPINTEETDLDVHETTNKSENALDSTKIDVFSESLHDPSMNHQEVNEQTKTPSVIPDDCRPIPKSNVNDENITDRLPHSRETNSERNVIVKSLAQSSDGKTISNTTQGNADLSKPCTSSDTDSTNGNDFYSCNSMTAGTHDSSHMVAAEDFSNIKQNSEFQKQQNDTWALTQGEETNRSSEVSPSNVEEQNKSNFKDAGADNNEKRKMEVEEEREDKDVDDGEECINKQIQGDINEPEREVKGNNSCLQTPTDIGISETLLRKNEACTVNPRNTKETNLGVHENQNKSEKSLEVSDQNLHDPSFNDQEANTLTESPSVIPDDFRSISESNVDDKNIVDRLPHSRETNTQRSATIKNLTQTSAGKNISKTTDENEDLSRSSNTKATVNKGSWKLSTSSDTDSPNENDFDSCNEIQNVTNYTHDSSHMEATGDFKHTKQNIEVQILQEAEENCIENDTRALPQGEETVESEVSSCKIEEENKNDSKDPDDDMTEENGKKREKETREEKNVNDDDEGDDGINSRVQKDDVTHYEDVDDNDDKKVKEDEEEKKEMVEEEDQEEYPDYAQMLTDDSRLQDNMNHDDDDDDDDDEVEEDQKDYPAYAQTLKDDSRLQEQDDYPECIQMLTDDSRVQEELDNSTFTIQELEEEINMMREKCQQHGEELENSRLAIQKLQGERHIMEERCQHHRDELEHQKTLNHTCTSRIRELEAHTRTIDEENIATKEELQNARLTIKRLKEDIQSIEENCLQLQEKLDEQSHANYTSGQQIEELQVKAKRVEEENIAIKDKLDEQNNTNIIYMQRIEELEIQANGLQEENTALSEREGKIKQEMEDFQSWFYEGERAKREAMKNVQEKEDVCKHLQNQLDSTQDKVNELTECIHQKEDQFQVKMREKDEVIVRQTEGLEKLKQAFQSAILDTACTKKKMLQLNEEIKSSKEELQIATTKIQRMKEEQNTSQISCRQLQDELVQRNNTNHILTLQIEELEAQSKEKDNQIIAINGEFEQEKCKNDICAQRIEELETENRNLEEESIVIKDKNDKIQHDLEQEKINLSVEVDNLKKQIDASQNELSTKSEENSRLTSEMDKLQDIFAKHEANELHRKVQELKDNLQEKTQMYQAMEKQFKENQEELKKAKFAIKWHEEEIHTKQNNCQQYLEQLQEYTNTYHTQKQRIEELETKSKKQEDEHVALNERYEKLKEQHEDFRSWYYEGEKSKREAITKMEELDDRCSYLQNQVDSKQETINQLSESVRQKESHFQETTQEMNENIDQQREELEKVNQAFKNAMHEIENLKRKAQQLIEDLKKSYEKTSICENNLKTKEKEWQKIKQELEHKAVNIERNLNDKETEWQKLKQSFEQTVCQKEQKITQIQNDSHRKDLALQNKEEECRIAVVEMQRATEEKTRAEAQNRTLTLRQQYHNEEVSMRDAEVTRITNDLHRIQQVLADTIPLQQNVQILQKQMQEAHIQIQKLHGELQLKHNNLLKVNYDLEVATKEKDRLQEEVKKIAIDLECQRTEKFTFKDSLHRAEESYRKCVNDVTHLTTCLQDKRRECEQQRSENVANKGRIENLVTQIKKLKEAKKSLEAELTEKEGRILEMSAQFGLSPFNENQDIDPSYNIPERDDSSNEASPEHLQRPSSTPGPNLNNPPSNFPPVQALARDPAAFLQLQSGSFSQPFGDQTPGSFSQPFGDQTPGSFSLPFGDQTPRRPVNKTRKDRKK